VSSSAKDRSGILRRNFWYKKVAARRTGSHSAQQPGGRTAPTENEISGKGVEVVDLLTVVDQRVSGVQPKLLLVQGQLHCLHIGHSVPPSRVCTIGEKLQNQIFGFLYSRWGFKGLDQQVGKNLGFSNLDKP
jgi:hypothetical protein